MVRGTHRARAASAALLVLLAASALSSCSLVPRTGGCVDYVSLPTAQDRYDAAAVVVVAQVTSTDRTAESTGRYVVHRAEVTAVLKGDPHARSLDVINPSDGCTTSYEPVTYAAGDSLADDGTYVLYLGVRAGSGPWSLLVPNGLDPASAAATLPHRR